VIIAFSGTDGAGKSTQINTLSRLLKESGRSPRYLWGRGGYTPLVLALKTLALRMLGRHGSTSGFDQAKSASYIERRAGLMQRPIVVQAWLAIAIVDMMVFYAIYARFLSLRGCVVICDRYIADTKIDFLRNFPGNFRGDGLLWRLLVAAAPKPDLHFLLTVPVDVSIERSRQKGEPFPDDPTTLGFRLNAYRTAPEFSDTRVLALDGTQPIDKVAADIRKALSTTHPCLVPP
jgi:dTMP kinase